MFSELFLLSSILCAIAATFQIIHYLIQTGVALRRFLKSKTHK
jgi:hypothetical protein